MQDTYSEIILNEEIGHSYWRIRFKTGWKDYVPGQFVMVEVPGKGIFLRRPFSIARLNRGVIEVCYKVVGQGTLSMSVLKAGTKAWVLGPLGNGFTLPKSRQEILLVAGGYGIAPLVGLAEKLKGNNVHLLYGTKTSKDLLYINELKKLGVKLHITTEDGSKGEKGLVTNSFKAFLTHQRTNAQIFACGPHGMLSAIQKLLTHQIHCQLSLESYMACGIGACIGCVVKDNRGNYIRVCKEGPVFDASGVEL